MLKIETEAMYAEKSWGTYTVIDVQPGSMTVKVSMRAGEHMSYHSHDYREEVWTVVSGSGKRLLLMEWNRNSVWAMLSPLQQAASMQ